MQLPTVLAPGAPCSCAANRTVRHAIPPVPGLPDGEVSCRLDGATGVESVRHHEFARGAITAVRCPEVSR